VTVCLLAIGLTSLAVGLGAVFPDFKQDNPARIANGIGGTATIMLSLIYIGSAIGMIIPPASVLMLNINMGAGTLQSIMTMLRDSWPWLAGAIALHAAIIIIPMAIGLKRWDRLEIHF